MQQSCPSSSSSSGRRKLEPASSGKRSSPTIKQADPFAMEVGDDVAADSDASSSSSSEDEETQKSKPLPPMVARRVAVAAAKKKAAIDGFADSIDGEDDPRYARVLKLQTSGGEEESETGGSEIEHMLAATLPLNSVGSLASADLSATDVEGDDGWQFVEVAA
ncbi:hypothetical protein HK102_012299, partial [Quaeritorhiza haematococci]